VLHALGYSCRFSLVLNSQVSYLIYEVCFISDLFNLIIITFGNNILNDFSYVIYGSMLSVTQSVINTVSQRCVVTDAAYASKLQYPRFSW
jgi:hypothetical protein